MATNNFKPFATAANANVTIQSDWEALPALSSGFVSGPAKSAQVNKALRQATFIASAVAQYVAELSGNDVLDDGDIAGFVNKLKQANDNRYVESAGGDYGAVFRFKGISTLPSINNPSSLFSEEGNPAQNTLVSGTEAAWYAHKVRAGILRDSGVNVHGYAVEIDGNRQFQTDLNGNLIAMAALYESGGTGTLVRVYSPNNPPPQQDLSGYLKKTDVGTTAGTVAAGNDSRITGALQSNNRLSEIAQAGAAAQQQAIDNLGGIHGRLVGSRAYTSSGTYVPGAGIKYARVTVTGGGGSGTGTPGGGYRGAGGGAGGTAIKYLALTAGSYQVNVGEGGKLGNAGGTSSFGTLVSATGGSGASGATGGYGGEGVGGDINIAGGAGDDSPGDNTGSTGGGGAGHGGASYWGGGMRSSTGTGAISIKAAAGGGGGGNVSNGGSNVQPGSDGIVYIEEFV
ncbi:hypothetical protein [Enterobacter bugandensis]|uniref:hypothetical protein n=1 Tax=Enterobacter bugandensis TaxID=881260 RepID=UPI002A821389|nr:hypothetical protein [Enterobacter bugandensis]